MRLYQLTEQERKKMGRELNHIEDLVFFYGSEGAQDSVRMLRDMSSDNNDLSIKWDGKVALYYGRDANGVFGMGTKGNWAKNNPLTSADGAYSYITTAGRGEDWRETMGQSFNEIFPMLEASVPVTFQGYVTGDLIYAPHLAPKTISQGAIQFTSNQVTYTVNPDSALGKRVAETEVGMALHLKYSEWNGTDRVVVNNDMIQELNSQDVLALGQTYAPRSPRIDQSVLDNLEALIRKNGNMIDQLISRRPGLSDISNIIYTFNNQMSRQGKSNTIGTELFFEWLSNSKVSASKQAKLKSIAEENPRAFPALFELVRAVAATKNNIIDQLEDATADITASTHGERGGEGFVSLKHQVKLVPRHRWKPS